MSFNKLEVLKNFKAIPSEAGLIESLKNDGHSLSEYFAELIDNSLDAKANEIKINILTTQLNANSKKPFVKRIVLGDNGTGFVSYKIEDALRIGQRKDGDKKIGRYGVGLKSAVFSMGECLTLLTKTKAGELTAYYWDRNNKTREDFGFSQVEINSELKGLYKKYAGDTGTVIVVDSIYSAVSNKLLNKHQKNPYSLSSDVGRIFHRKIEKQDVVITIDSKKVESNPLINKVSKTYVNQVLKNGDGALKLKFVLMDEVSPSETDRGTYVYLNDRLITLRPIQDKEFKFDHATFNHLRLELNISSWQAVSAENGLQVNNQKNGIQIGGKIKEEINSLIYPHIKEYRDSKTNSNSNKEDTSLTEEKESNQKTTSKKEKSWLELSKHCLLKPGATISAKEQKTILENKNSTDYEHQPRLLNKFDSSEDLPKTLKSKGVVPIAKSNSEMVFVKIDDVFMNISKLNKKNIQEFHVKKQNTKILKSLSIADITSEKKALNFCYHYGLFHEAFKEEELYRTVEGMERVNSMNIKIGNENIKVEGVQIETDAGFEGKSLHLIEAKMIDDHMEDISIRQLIYPHSHYELKMYGSKLEVKSWLFLFYKEEKIVRLIPVNINTAKGQYSLGKEEKVFQLK